MINDAVEYVEFVTADGGTFCGERFADGGVLGFDYGAQCWSDTRPGVARDSGCQVGSACNPLRELPARDYVKGLETRLTAAVSAKLGAACVFVLWIKTPAGDIPVFDVPVAVRARADELGVTYHE